MSDILLIIIVLIIASGLLKRILFYGIQKYFQKMVKDFNRSNQQTTRQTNNQKTFWSNNKPNSSSNNDTGEYIDYEEIK